MKKHRILFWALLALFVVGAILWTFHVPYRPSELYRLIPPNAVYMSHHERLGERWEEFLANPLARTLFTSMGLELEELEEWTDDPETRVWLDKLLARDLVLVHTPAMGPGRDSAWVIAGWIGGESIRLRWLLSRGRIEGFEKIRRATGGSYWLVNTGDDVKEHLSISIVEGMIVGAFSKDPHAIRHIVDIYDGLVQGHPFADTHPTAMDTCGDEYAMDRGWFIAPHYEGGEARYFFGFSQVDPRGMRGTLCMQQPGELPSMRTTDVEIPARLFGGLPFAVVGMNPEAGYAFLLNQLPPTLQTIFQGLYETNIRDVFMLKAMGGDYTGTLAGIAVPALMAVWPVEDEQEALEGMQALVDRLNAMFRWGLVVTETRSGGRPVHVIESTAATPYAAFRFRERVAYTAVDGWIVLSTHAFPLMRVLDRYDGPESLFEADQGGWQREVRRGTAAAYGYLDLAGGARTLRLALSAYSMKLLFDDPQGSRELRQRLNEVRAWIDTLEPIGGGHLWLDQQEGVLSLRFAVGDKGE